MPLHYEMHVAPVSEWSDTIWFPAHRNLSSTSAPHLTTDHLGNGPILPSGRQVICKSFNARASDGHPGGAGDGSVDTDMAMPDLRQALLHLCERRSRMTAREYLCKYLYGDFQTNSSRGGLHCSAQGFACACV